MGGALIGAIIQAPLSNKFGRKLASRAASVIAIIAGALQAGSVNVAMICFSRVLCGIAAGMSISNTPVYMSEVAPPHVRGLLVGLQGVGIVGSYIACSVVALIFSYVETDYQWRLTFVVLTLVALLHMGSLFLIPESPRWLMEKGREDEALEVLEYLHKHDSDPNGTFAHAEAKQISAQVEAESKLPKGYTHIFKTPSLRKRALCSILLWVMGQGTGVTAIANLIPTFMGGLGFGTTMQLGLGVAWCACLMIGCAINITLMDRVGRVKLLGKIHVLSFTHPYLRTHETYRKRVAVIGGWLNGTIIAILGALVKFYLNSSWTPGVNAVVAFYFIFGVAFTSTIECTAYVYGSEIWPTYLRSEGSTIAYVSFMANAIAYSAPVVQALDTIRWKFFMVFVAVTISTTIVIMFYFPEVRIFYTTAFDESAVS